MSHFELLLTFDSPDGQSVFDETICRLHEIKLFSNIMTLQFLNFNVLIKRTDKLNG